MIPTMQPRKGYRDHATATLVEALAFRAAGRYGPLFEGLIHGYIVKGMDEEAGGLRREGIGPLLKAAAARLSQKQDGKEKWGYEKRHCFQVGALSYIIAAEAIRTCAGEMPGAEPDLCLAGGYVHDIGKTFLPMWLVIKELGVDCKFFTLFEGERLSDREIKVMRNEHLMAGTGFIRMFGAGRHIKTVMDMTGLHHVTFDGNDTTHPSYPKLMKGQELPFHCRVAKTADFVSAVLPRHYKQDPWIISNEDAIAYAITVAGKELDPTAVRCLITGLYDIDRDGAGSLIMDLAYNGNGSGISDRRTLQNYIEGNVRKHNGFRDLMERGEPGRLSGYRSRIGELSTGYGIPVSELTEN